MEPRLVDFAQLREEDLKRLALLHRSVMHGLLSDLGLPLVYRYYRIAGADPAAIGRCAVSADGQLLGWAVGSPHPDKINAQLRSPLIWFLFQMLRITLTRPVLLWQLISSVFSSSRQPELNPGSIELTYIGVAPSHRGHGIGTKLLDAFMEASRSQGYRSIALSVERENSSAIALYERAGFKVVRTFAEGRYRRHRMELTLE